MSADTWTRLSVLFALASAGLPASAEPFDVAGQRLSFSAEETTPPRLSLREDGEAPGENGLLKKLKGPAAEFRDPRQLTLQTGLTPMAGASFPARYLFGRSRQELSRNTTVSLEFIGAASPRDALLMNEHGPARAAFEAQLTRRMGPVTFSFSQLENDGVPSERTGVGARLDRSMSEASVNMWDSPVPFGFAFRRQVRADGVLAEQIRAYQTAQLGSITLSHSTDLPIRDSDGGVSGTLLASAYHGRTYGYVEFDYGGGQRGTPSAAFAAELMWSAPEDWKVTFDATRVIDGGFTQFDFAVATDLASIRVGPFASWSSTLGSFVGLRVSTQLTPEGRPTAWRTR